MMGSRRASDRISRASPTPDLPSAIPRIDIHRSFEAARSGWRAFEREAVCTPYQRFDWVEAWYRHVGKTRSLDPLLVTARDEDDRIAFIWPLVVGSSGGARIASWPGGKFANYNLGLYSRTALPVLAAPVLRRVLRHIRTEARVDALSLRNQPEVWQGTSNPLLQLPHQASPSFGYSLALKSDFDALFVELRSGSTRKKLRRSESRIESEFGSCTVRRANDPEQVDGVLAAFVAQKSQRMQEKSISNVFAAPGVMEFFREIAVRGLGSSEPLLELFWLDAGGHTAATWAGTVGGSRMCGIFNSFDLGACARHQPGEVLLRHLIELCCDRNLADFDLGVGEAAYKNSWCPRTDRMFDSFLPLSPAGWMHSSIAMTGFRLKRAVKQSKFLRELTERFR